MPILKGADWNNHNSMHLITRFLVSLKLMYCCEIQVNPKSFFSFYGLKNGRLMTIWSSIRSRRVHIKNVLNECNRSWFLWKGTAWRVRATIEAASQINSTTILWFPESLLLPLKICFVVLERYCSIFKTDVQPSLKHKSKKSFFNKDNDNLVIATLSKIAISREPSNGGHI